MVSNKKRKPVFIKRKWNHVVLSRATILSFHLVDKIQQNNKCTLYGDKNEIIYHMIISECRKIMQNECKCRLDWEENVIHWELCKKLKFDHTTKWYMHKPESVQVNETHKICWNFEIQTDHLILTRRPNLMIVNKRKRTCHFVDFAIPVTTEWKPKIAERDTSTSTLPEN